MMNKIEDAFSYLLYLYERVILRLDEKETFESWKAWSKSATIWAQWGTASYLEQDDASGKKCFRISKAQYKLSHRAAQRYYRMKKWSKSDD